MSILILIFISIFLINLKANLKLSIDLKSFFCKGFKKIDNQFGLYCFCGKQGKGKTYSMIRFAIDRKLSTNCVILTNIKSFTLFNDTIFFDNIINLIDFVNNYCSNLSPEETPNILILYDEIFTILEKNTKINKDILSFISQLRKRNLVFCTTAQEWLEINVTFRRYVRYQVECNMVKFLNFTLQINQVFDGEKLKWSNEENEYVAPIIQTNISKGKKSIIDSYDTFEVINVDTKKINSKKTEVSLLQAKEGSFFLNTPSDSAEGRS